MADSQNFERQATYISNPFGRFNRPTIIAALRTTMPPSDNAIPKNSNDFYPIVDKDVIDLYQDVEGIESDFLSTIIRASDIELKSKTEDEMKKLVNETKGLIEIPDAIPDIEIPDDHENINFLKKIQNDYPPTLAAALVFKDSYADFNKTKNRINILKLILENKNNTEKNKKTDPYGNTIGHLLIKSFSKNSKPPTSTDITTNTTASDVTNTTATNTTASDATVTDAAVTDAASGDAASGDAASGDAASGDAAGDAASGDAASGDAAGDATVTDATVTDANNTAAAVTDAAVTAATNTAASDDAATDAPADAAANTNTTASDATNTAAISDVDNGLIAAACNNALAERPKYMQMLEELSTMLRFITNKPKVEYAAPEGSNQPQPSNIETSIIQPNDSILHSAQLLADSLHRPDINSTVSINNIEFKSILSSKNSTGETAIELFQKHDSSTPFNTYERRIHGFTFSCYTNGDESTKHDEKKIYQFTEEIKGLLNPDNYSGASNSSEENISLEFNENVLLKLDYYYIYGLISDYSSGSPDIIKVSYHQFVKINKRLHSIMDKIYYDLSNYKEKIDCPSDKQYFALGFYNNPIDNDFDRLDLFFYNSFSYYDIFGLDDLIDDCVDDDEEFEYDDADNDAASDNDESNSSSAESLSLSESEEDDETSVSSGSSGLSSLNLSNSDNDESNSSSNRSLKSKSDGSISSLSSGDYDITNEDYKFLDEYPLDEKDKSNNE